MTITDALRAARAALPRDWIVPEWDGPPGIAAFTTTRNGPDSRADVDMRGALDEPARVALLGSLLPSLPVWLRQVHGITVATISASNLEQMRAQPPSADALVTTLAGVPLAVQHADCLPILLSSADGRVIAAVHAGWRGLAAGVVEATVAAMRETQVSAPTFGAWLGPAIGPAAFEVGSDVIDAFCSHDPRAKSAFVATGPGKWHADLYRLARQRLVTCGVTAIAGGGLCTVTDSARFFSHRRDRDPRRMASFIHRV